MSNRLLQYQSVWWKIEFPSNWTFEKQEECVSFYEENGVGSLQISAYSKDKEVSEEDLLEFVTEEVPEGEIVNKIKLAEYSGLKTDYKFTDHYWRMWFLKKKNILLFIRYNCEFEDRNEERDTINVIIESLK